MMKTFTKEYDQFFEKKVLSEHPAYYDFLSKLCEGKCLDIACANGGWLLSRVPNAIGVDFSPVAIRQLREKNIEGVVGNAQELPFIDQSFDTLVSLGSIEHFLSPEKAVSEMGRVIKEGGHLVLTFNPQVSLPFSILEKFLGMWGKFRSPEYITQPIDSRLSLNQVSRHLLKNGFRIIFEGSYTRTILTFGRFHKLARRLLPFSWRTAPCVHFFYCEKSGLKSIEDYGPYFPRR